MPTAKSWFMRRADSYFGNKKVESSLHRYNSKWIFLLIPFFHIFIGFSFLRSNHFCSLDDGFLFLVIIWFIRVWMPLFVQINEIQVSYWTTKFLWIQKKKREMNRIIVIRSFHNQATDRIWLIVDFIAICLETKLRTFFMVFNNVCIWFLAIRHLSFDSQWQPDTFKG